MHATCGRLAVGFDVLQLNTHFCLVSHSQTAFAWTDVWYNAYARLVQNPRNWEINSEFHTLVTGQKAPYNYSFLPHTLQAVWNSITHTHTHTHNTNLKSVSQLLPQSKIGCIYHKRKRGEKYYNAGVLGKRCMVGKNLRLASV